MLDELKNQYVTVRVLKKEYEDFFSVWLVYVCAKYFNFSKVYAFIGLKQYVKIDRFNCFRKTKHVKNKYLFSHILMYL